MLGEKGFINRHQEARGLVSLSVCLFVYLYVSLDLRAYSSSGQKMFRDYSNKLQFFLRFSRI